MTLPSFARICCLFPVLLASACSHVGYVPAPRTLACSDVADWNERQVCRQKADKYNEDWQRRERTGA